MKKLTAKQQKFVNRYAVHGNATQAAIEAGYSKRSAAVIGSDNLTKAEIARAIAIKQAEFAKSSATDAATLRASFLRIAGKAEESEEFAAATGALANIARMNGDFNDKLVVETSKIKRNLFGLDRKKKPTHA
jgi:phage terminase small subunit